MAIDPAKEELISLCELANRLDVHYETVRSWADPSNGARSRFAVVKGLRRTQPLVVLETIQAPGGRRTSMEAYHRMLAAMNGSATST